MPSNFVRPKDAYIAGDSSSQLIFRGILLAANETTIPSDFLVHGGFGRDGFGGSERPDVETYYGIGLFEERDGQRKMTQLAVNVSSQIRPSAASPRQ